MPAINLCFQVHYPLQLSPFTFFDLGKGQNYVDWDTSLKEFSILATKCYLPANQLLLEIIKEFPSDVHFSFSMSGLWLDTIVDHFPKVLASFQQLVDTGKVELLAQPYDHSLSMLIDRQYFLEQLDLHSLRMYRYFGQRPQVLCNTSLIYHNHLGFLAQKHRLKGIITQMVPQILRNRQPYELFFPPDVPQMPIFLRDAFFSDVLDKYFSLPDWEHYPLYADTYASWIHQTEKYAKVLTLVLDYHLFGIRHPAEGGIFQFFYHVVKEILVKDTFTFKTPSQILKVEKPDKGYDVGRFISVEHGIDSWYGNNMQKEILTKLYELRKAYVSHQEKIHPPVWAPLYQADHYYRMGSKKEELLSKYHTRQDDPFEKYVVLCNILADMKLTLQEKIENQA